MSNQEPLLPDTSNDDQQNKRRNLDISPTQIVASVGHVAVDAVRSVIDVSGVLVQGVKNGLGKLGIAYTKYEYDKTPEELIDSFSDRQTKQ